jgi:hypothetical protein
MRAEDISLTDEELKLALALAEHYAEGDSASLEDALSDDYAESPVPPEEFFTNPYYIGEFSKELYKTWFEELCYVLTPDNGIKEWIIYGSIGTGKTSAAVAAQLYTAYKLSCMKNPQKSFGLASHFPIYLAFFNVTKMKAQDSLASKFSALINLSPYFRERLKKNVRKIFLPGAASMFGAGYREHPKKDDLYTVELPHNIHLLFGSRVQHAMSLDIFSAVMDEMNFRGKRSITQDMDEDSAEALYNQVLTRVTSRFIRNPGLLVNISSAKANTSFIEKRIEEVQKTPEYHKHVHVSDFALWEVKPWDYPSGNTFRVFVGAGDKQNKIIGDDEIIDLDAGEQIIHVPMELERRFETKLDISIRDLAGVATAAVNRLFSRPEVIRNAIDITRENPIYPETIEIGLKHRDRIEYHFDTEFVSYYNNMERLLKYHRGITRFIHVDLAKNKDSVGIAGGCIPLFYQRKTKNEHGQSIVQQLPFLYVDFVVRVKAIHGDQIEFEKVRQFLLWLRDTPKYPIARVSYDSWQSVHSLQMLETDGLDTETISVDKTDEPYLELHTAFVENRISIPKHGMLINEFQDLEHDITGRFGKVDHPVGGSKDVADAVCGMYWNALEYIRKNGTASLGNTSVVEWSLKDKDASPKDAKVKKTAKEMGYDEPVYLDVPPETKLNW